MKYDKMLNPAVVHLIDDDKAVRRSLAFLLSAAGLKVHTYESAMAFLNILSEVEPGCIVADIHMPRVDGIELIRRLRGRASDMPVIAITGRGDVPLAVKAIRAGAVDFLEKPSCAELLVTWIRSALVCRECDGTLEIEDPGRLVSGQPSKKSRVLTRDSVLEE